jgi:hypothetical protein
LIPLDLVGTAIVELRDSSAEVLHLAHPKYVSLEFVFRYITKVLDVPLVPYSQWFARLEASQSEQIAKQDSALRLLEFYRSIETDERLGNASFPRLVTDIAQSAFPALRDVPVIGDGDIQKWLDYWKGIGVIAF